MVVKHKLPSGKQITIRPRAVIRLGVAFGLLFTLLAGSISWSALAGARLCTLACCAGKAAHAAGSCMHASCDSSLKTASSHAHHHHAIAQVASDAPAGFAGAIASVGGSGLDDVPTIDVSNNQNPQIDSTAQHLAAVDSISVGCSTECGACSAAFIPNKRPRNAVVGAGAHKNVGPSVARSPAGRFTTIDLKGAFNETATPRGPPSFLANSHS